MVGGATGATWLVRGLAGDGATLVRGVEGRVVAGTTVVAAAGTEVVATSDVLTEDETEASGTETLPAGVAEEQAVARPTSRAAVPVSVQVIGLVHRRRLDDQPGDGSGSCCSLPVVVCMPFPTAPQVPDCPGPRKVSGAGVTTSAETPKLGRTPMPEGPRRASATHGTDQDPSRTPLQPPAADRLEHGQIRNRVRMG